MQPFSGTGPPAPGPPGPTFPPPNPPSALGHPVSSSASSSAGSSSSSLVEDLLKLSAHLKRETLYVQNTKRQLVQLHEEVSRQSQGLAQQVWVCAHQRQNSETMHSSTSPASCVQRSNTIEAVKFVDAYRSLGHADVSRYGEALERFRHSPKALALALVKGESALPPGTISGGLLSVARVIVTSLYNSCLLAEDENLMLCLLSEIIRLQVPASSDPRRLIRKSSTAFHITFKLFSESLYAAKLFLTASLYEPIMRILMDDEWFYDIDPDKAFVRFPPQERLRRFGRPDAADHAGRVAKYREFTTNKLFLFANRFIQCIKSNMYCFPQSIRILVNHLYAVILKKGGGTNQSEALAVCADLVFSLFICPAICDPEPLGITDNISISYISRHNLMQVAQILQVLVVSKREDIDPKVRDLYSKFQANSLSLMIEGLLDSNVVDGQAPAAPFEAGRGSAAQGDAGSTRSAVLMTAQELGILLHFFRSISSAFPDASPERIHVESLISGLPETLPDHLQVASALAPSTGSHFLHGTNSTPGHSPSSSPLVTPRKPASSSGGKKSRSKLGAVQSSPGSLQHQHNAADDGSAVSGDGTNTTNQNERMDSEVLTIPIGSGSRSDVPGMLSETKVLTLHSNHQRQRSEPTKAYRNRDSNATVTATTRSVLPQPLNIAGESMGGVDETASMASSTVESVEKRTRFSFSHGDHDSIDAGGCPSEYNLEAISEAGASNQSVASSIDLEANCNDNDNLSDMISANVSGRGTPNVSGRDTPLSQVEGSEAPIPEGRQDIPGTFKKQKQDISESFYKFEIRTLLDENETKSVISDSWSTDVVASDFSEPPESSQLERLEEIVEEVLPHGLLEVGSGLDRVDACSEAWSTDVLASDSEYGRGEVETQERLNELKELDEGSISGRSGRSLSQEELTGGMQRTLGQDNDDSPGSEDTGVAGDAPTSSSLGDAGSAGASRAFAGPASSSTSGAGTGYSPGSNTSSGAGFFSAGQPLPSLSVSSTVEEGHTSTPTSRKSKTHHYHHHHPHGGRSRDAPTAEPRNDSVLRAFDPFSSDINRMVNNKGETAQFRRRSKGHKTASTPDPSSVALRDPFQASPKDSLDSNDSATSAPAPPSTAAQSSLVSPTGSTSSSFSGHSAGTGTSSSATSQNQLAVLVDGIATSLNLDVDLAVSSRRSTFRLDDALSVFDPLSSSDLEADAIQNGFSGNERPASATPRGEESLSEADPGVGASSSSTVVLSTASKSRSESSNIASLLFSPTDDADSSVNGPKRDAAAAAARIADRLSSSPKMLVSLGDTGAPGSTGATTVVVASHAGGVVGGAIPKSYSFNEGGSPFRAGDSDGPFGKPAFLKKIPNFKIPSFKGIKPLQKRSVTRNDERVEDNALGGSDEATVHGENGSSFIKSSSSTEEAADETSDSILEKYRSPNKRERFHTLVDTSDSATHARQSLDDESTVYYDPYNVEGCPAFADAKRKLRMVLASADYHTLPSLMTFSSGMPGGSGKTDEVQESYLITYLKVQLAEAINLGDKDLVAQLNETLRCVRRFDNSACVKLVQSIQEDYHQRAIYVAYLVQTQQNQLSTLAHLRHLGERVQCDKQTIGKHFIALCVRQFLERFDRPLLKFINEFQRLSVMDEKVSYVEQMLAFLYAEMDRDNTWQVTSEAQLEEARLSVERNLMGRIYSAALYPNGDADVNRDDAMRDHIDRLSKDISPNSQELAIPKAFHSECPWPSAQMEIITINAYKTPRDKVQCVVRCCHVIQNLLKMASQGSAPGADDIVPVLIYVLIKANPPSLLSTLQYVSSFYEKRLSGEEEYWWAQFTGAVMFVKMMGNKMAERNSD